MLIYAVCGMWHCGYNLKSVNQRLISQWESTFYILLLNIIVNIPQNHQYSAIQNSRLWTFYVFDDENICSNLIKIPQLSDKQWIVRFL